MFAYSFWKINQNYLLDPVWNLEQYTYVNVTGCEHDIENFAAVIDDKMQFEAKKPTC